MKRISSDLNPAFHVFWVLHGRFPSEPGSRRLLRQLRSLKGHMNETKRRKALSEARIARKARRMGWEA